MFPIGDENVPGAPPPIVNITLIVVNVLVFLYELALGSNLDAFIATWAVIPASILRGQDLITLITSQFLHGGWLHLIGNMLFLWVFGDNIEATLGHFLYLVFYLAAGVVAGLAQVFFSAGSLIPSIGASGAIAGVLGAYIVLFPGSRIRTLVVLYFATVTRISAIFFLGIWFVMQFFSGITSLGVETAQTGGVAYWAHIGGFVVGALVGLVARPFAHSRVVQRYWQ